MALCAAQYPSSNRRRVHFLSPVHARTKRIRPVASLSTTLVLRRQAPDFSTDASNSALILATKSPTARERPVLSSPAGRKITTGFPSPLAHQGGSPYATEEAFSSTIRCRDRHVIRGADICALYSNC